jgi:hypothetical protein
MQLMWLGRCGGDSVFAFDPELNRVTVLTAQGGVVRTFTVSAGRNRPAYAVRCDQAGTLLVIGWPGFPSAVPLGPYRETQALVLADRMGNVRVTIGEFRGDERIRLTHSDGPRIFGKKLAAAIGRDRVYVGQADSFHIQMFDFRKRVVGAIHRGATPLQRVTRNEIRVHVENHLAAILDPSARESQRRGFATYDFPEVFPPYSGIEVHPLGEVWVRSFRAPGTPTERWSVFAPDGRFVEEVTMPVNVEALHIGRDRVVTRRMTPLGEHEVQVFRLVRPK